MGEIVELIQENWVGCFNLCKNGKILRGYKTQKAHAKHVAWAFILRGCFLYINKIVIYFLMRTYFYFCRIIFDIHFDRKNGLSNCFIPFENTSKKLTLINNNFYEKNHFREMIMISS